MHRLRPFWAILMLPALTVPARAELQIAQPVRDLGELRSGPAQKQTFFFVNAGTEAIEITDTKGSCGCLTPHISNRKLEPGQAGSLELEVNTLSEPAGPSLWRVKITYTEGGQPREAQVEITARLIKEVSVEPASLNIFTEKGIAEEVLITDLRLKPLTVTSVRATSPQIKTQLKEPTADPAGHLVQCVGLEVAPDFPEGRHEEAISIYTNDGAYPELKLAVTVVKHAKQRVSATPGEVTISAAPGQPLPSRLLIVRDSEGQEVVVDKVTADDAALTCRWAQGPGTNATVRVLSQPGRAFQSNIHIQISKPVPQTVTVPVTVENGPSPGS